MSLPTGSALDRADHCPASCALPQVDSTSPDAKWGTAGHRFLALVGGGSTSEAALAQVPEEYREACAAIDLEGLPLGSGWAQEVTYAFDLYTGRERCLGAGLERDYSARKPSEIVGTIDVVSGLGSAPKIWDYKFDGYDSTARAPAENPQVLFAALCACRCSGWDEADVGLVHFRADGSHWQESAHIDALALDEFELRLHRIARGVMDAEAQVRAGIVPPVHRGDHCKYCPAVAACPAVLDLVRAAAGEPNRTIGELLSVLTPETAQRAYARLRDVDGALKEVKAALYLYASENPIELDDGMVYGPVHSERMDLDGRIARQAIAAWVSPEVAEAACEFSTSKAAITRALRSVYEAQARAAREAKERGERVPRPTIKALLESVLAKIGEAGGIKTRDVVQVREHYDKSRDRPLIDSEGDSACPVHGDEP